MSPGQGHALDSCSLSVTAQNWLSAQFDPMEYLQEFGIFLRGNEQDRTSQVWSRKEMSVLPVGEGTCVGFGLLLLPKIFNKGIF